MTDQKKNVWLKTLIIVVIVLLIPKFFQLIGGHDVEKVREKMEKSLLEEYGQEFVVDRIGTRAIRGETHYQARIYPKSIVGTNKEGDSYYYAKAGVEKKAFGRLGKVGAGYETVQIKIEAENYVRSKAREIFGDRIRLKADVKFKKKKEGNDYFSWQIRSNFEKLLEETKADPKNKRIELELYVYIFDRIDDEDEKEERRKQIFEFVQYLKEEDLFKYLEMGVIFIDERVLAPSYDKYKRKIFLSEKVEKEVYGETVYLPPMELRKEMSEVLQNEIDNMSEEELLANIKRIRKGSVNDLRGFNTNYGIFIYSWGILEIKYTSALKRRDINRDYSKLMHVKLGEGTKYIYLNKMGE